MSFSRNSTASDIAHATSSGPRSFARGSPNRPIAAAASSSRLSARYAARNIDDEDLAELRRLERERPDLDPQPRAVDRRAPMPGNDRQQQQHRPTRPIVYVYAFELPVVTDEQQRHAERAQATISQSPARRPGLRVAAGRASRARARRASAAVGYNPGSARRRQPSGRRTTPRRSPR